MERFCVCDKCDKLTEFHEGVEFSEFGFLCLECYRSLLDEIDKSRESAIVTFLG